MKTDSELRWVGFQVLFKLMRRAVAQSKVAVVAGVVRVEVMGHFQAGFSEGSEGRAGGQQRASTRALSCCIRLRQEFSRIFIANNQRFILISSPTEAGSA